MATYRIPIYGFSINPDNSGDAFFEPSSVKNTNDLYNELNLIFNDTATKDSIDGSFVVPKNYVDNAKFVFYWKSTATSGNQVLDIDYTAIADGETTDPSSHDESITATVAVPGTTNLLKITSISATSANFSVDDLVKFIHSRDGAVGGPTDTIAAAVTILAVLFEYTDV